MLVSVHVGGGVGGVANMQEVKLPAIYGPVGSVLITITITCENTVS